MNFLEMIWSVIVVIGRFFLLVFMGFALLMVIFSLKDGQYGVTAIAFIMFLLILWAYVVNFRKRKNKGIHKGG